MTTSPRDEPFDDAAAVRAVVLAATFVVVVVLVVTMVQAQDRGSASAATVPGVDRLVVTASAEPVAFAEAVVWSLPSQAATLASVDDRPVVTIDDADAGALVGLRGPRGLVALAMLPAGLGEQPAELLISSTSTALTVAALHPDLMSRDAETQLASMLAVSLAPSFPDLVERVDGRPLVSWQADDLEILARVVFEAGLPAVEATCPSAEPVDVLVAWCSERNEIQNSGHRSVLIGGADGSLCAVAPARLARVSAEGRLRLAAMIGLGAVPASPTDAIAVRPATVDGSACEPPFSVAPSESEAFSVWADVAHPLARLLGEPAELEDAGSPDAVPVALLAESGIGDGPLTPAERAVAAVRFAQTPRGASELGLLPLTAEAVERLDDLADLLAVLLA